MQILIENSYILTIWLLTKSPKQLTPYQITEVIDVGVEDYSIALPDTINVVFHVRIFVIDDEAMRSYPISGDNLLVQCQHQGKISEHGDMLSILYRLEEVNGNVTVTMNSNPFEYKYSLCEFIFEQLQTIVDFYYNESIYRINIEPTEQ